MAARNFADQLFAEIFGIGATASHLNVWRSDSPDSDAQYWSTGDLCPEQAYSIAAAVGGSIRKKFNPSAIDGGMVIRTRISPSKRLARYVDARATVLFCPMNDDELAQVDAMRSLAAQLLAGLSHQALPSGNQFLQGAELPTSPADLAAGPLSSLLGTRIATPLTAHIPGRPTLELAERMRDAPHKDVDKEDFVVTGHILTTKSQGRYQSVSIDGRRGESLGGAKFKEPKVVYPATLRDDVARAVRDPWRKLRLSLTCTKHWTGKAHPQVTYTLTALSFA